MTTNSALPAAFRWRPILSFGMVLALSLMAYRTFVGGVAAMPPVFEGAPTLAQALAAQAASPGSKPIFAFATADWCPPCQTMKRSTLIEPGVSAFIRDNTTPVYVNIDHDPAAANMLHPTRGIPATFVIVGNLIVAEFVGAFDAETYLHNLKAAVDLANSPDELARLGDSVPRLAR